MGLIFDDVCVWCYGGIMLFLVDFEPFSRVFVFGGWDSLFLVEKVSYNG